jgi:uncharacterized protein
MERVLKDVFEAKRFHERFLGLMGRGSWPSSHRGIWFSHCRSVHTFFTFLKPDLLFMDAQHHILKIFHSADPWKVFMGPPDTAHCLELPSGSARSLQLEIGDKVQR